MDRDNYRRGNNRGGRRPNFRNYGDNIDPYVQQINEATGEYYSTKEITHYLNQMNNDVQACIRFLNEKRTTSWSSVVSPTQIVVSNPPPENKNDRVNKKNVNGNQEKSSPKQSNTTSNNNSPNSNSNNSNSNKSQSNITPSTKQNNNTTTTNEVTSSSTNSVTQNYQPSNSNQTNTSPELKPTDFDFVERTLAEKQLQINREAEMLSTLLQEIKNLKESKNSRLGILIKEKDQLDDKIKSINEEYEKLVSQLKEKEDIIMNFEKDFNTQFLNLQKRVEMLMSQDRRLLNH